MKVFNLSFKILILKLPFRGQTFIIFYYAKTVALDNATVFDMSGGIRAVQYQRASCSKAIFPPFPSLVTLSLLFQGSNPWRTEKKDRHLPVLYFVSLGQNRCTLFVRKTFKFQLPNSVAPICHIIFSTAKQKHLSTVHT